MRRVYVMSTTVVSLNDLIITTNGTTEPNDRNTVPGVSARPSSGRKALNKCGCRTPRLTGATWQALLRAPCKRSTARSRQPGLHSAGGCPGGRQQG